MTLLELLTHKNHRMASSFIHSCLFSRLIDRFQIQAYKKWSFWLYLTWSKLWKLFWCSMCQTCPSLSLSIAHRQMQNLRTKILYYRYRSATWATHGQPDNSNILRKFSEILAFLLWCLSFSLSVREKKLRRTRFGC